MRPSIIQHVECGHQLCQWRQTVIGKREAQLVRQAHMSTCFHRPRVERGSTSMLMCRNRQHGCGYVQPFKPGQQQWAINERANHEKWCEYARP